MAVKVQKLMRQICFHTYIVINWRENLHSLMSNHNATVVRKNCKNYILYNHINITSTFSWDFFIYCIFNFILLCVLYLHFQSVVVMQNTVLINFHLLLNLNYHKKTLKILITQIEHWRSKYDYQTCHKFTPFPSTEEVIDCHLSDCGGVALRGCGELFGEAIRPPAANVWSNIQQPLDVLQAAIQGLQATPGLC